MSEAQERSAAEVGAAEVAPTVTERDRQATWSGALFRRVGEAGLFTEGLARGEVAAVRGLALTLAGFGRGALDAGLALAWAAHLAGAALPIAALGTDLQRRVFLPTLARGATIGALAHAEAGVADDPLSVRTRATRSAGGFSLSGAKRRVVNAGVADLYLVTAVTSADRGVEGVSAFLVERGAPGLAVGPRHDTTGLRTAVLADVTLDRCEVPDTSLLGAEGEGVTRVLRAIRRWERILRLAPWLGLEEEALIASTVARAGEQIELGRPLARSQSFRASLADMRISWELASRMLLRAAELADVGDPGADHAGAMAELFVMEGLAEVTRAAARAADTLDPRDLAARLHRDAGALSALAGRAEVARSVVAGSLLGVG